MAVSGPESGVTSPGWSVATGARKRVSLQTGPVVTPIIIKRSGIDRQDTRTQTFNFQTLTYGSDEDMDDNMDEDVEG